MILTEDAAERIKYLANEDEQPEVFRVFVEGGGCHGFSYGFAFEDNIETDDTVVEVNGTKIIIDSMSILYLEEAKIDFISSVHGDRFVIDNPNATTTCGCGSSFSL